MFACHFNLSTCLLHASIIVDIKQEKTHVTLLHNVEDFDASKLHHANTRERHLLPDTTSEF